MSLRTTLTKPKVGEIWREGFNGPLVEITDVGLRYANVCTPGNGGKFKRMVRFQDLVLVKADEITAPPPTGRPSQEEMDEMFLGDLDGGS